MLRSHLRPLTLLLCFLFSVAVSIGVLPLPTAIIVNTPIVLAQTSTQQQGRQLYETGQFAKAITVWEQASQALAAQGDRLNQASVLSNLALAYQQLNDWERAETTITQSLDLLQTIDPGTSPQVAALFAQVWNTQGNLALLRSQPAQALAAFETATDYYKQSGNSQGEYHSRLNQVRSLQALGFYRRALTALSHTSQLASADASVLQLQLMGDLQRMTGDLDAAQISLEQGLAQAQTHSENIAELQLSLGHVALARDATELALNHYQIAVDTAGSPLLQLRAQLSQWSLLYKNSYKTSYKTGNPTAADRLYQTIQANLARLPVSRVTVNARLELVRQQLGQATDQQRVIEELAIARQQAVALGDIRAESYALGYLGELYQQQDRWQYAEGFIRQALTLAENIKAPDLSYQWHWHLGQLQYQQGKATEASLSYDNAVRNLQLLRRDLIAIAPDLRFDFREQVEPVYREWVDLLLTETQASTADTQIQLLKARQAIESLQLAELENFFQEPCVPISQEIDQVIENSASPTAVFYPIILSDRLEIILKLPQQPLQQYTVHIPQAELEILLTDLQHDLLLPFTLKKVQAEARQLYDWLIRPTEAALETHQIETLVFVLDGLLRNIPMATLYDGQQYLVEKYSIALAPGLQLVDPQPLQRQRLATIVAGLSEARHGFAKLSFVKDEVEQIQKSTRSRVLLNESFTASNLEAEINNTPFPIVHLATHGQFSSNPKETFVLAWDQPIKMNALNRLLRQGEQTRQHPIELLILSACETAAGDKRAALGLAGVAVQAGARSTLASLWNLDDESGAIFSNLFYQELQTPDISKAQALRNAQLRLLRSAQVQNPIFQHPRYWAPYVLLGNWL